MLRSCCAAGMLCRLRWLSVCLSSLRSVGLHGLRLDRLHEGGLRGCLSWCQGWMRCSNVSGPLGSRLCLRGCSLGGKNTPPEMIHNVKRIEPGLPERNIEKLMECLLL